MEYPNERLLEKLRQHGLTAKITSLAHIGCIKEEMSSLRDQELISDGFFNQNLNWINYDYTEVMPDAKSILVLTYPQSITRVHF